MSTKFLKLEISRSESTDIYLEVPDDFDLGRHLPWTLLTEAAVKTVSNGDWDNFGWESTLEVHGRTIVKEDEAKGYQHLTIEQVLPFLLPKGTPKEEIERELQKILAPKGKTESTETPPLSFKSQIPDNLYIVNYMTRGGIVKSELPATDLETARKEAKNRAKLFEGIATIRGIGPKADFVEVVKPD